MLRPHVELWPTISRDLSVILVTETVSDTMYVFLLQTLENFLSISKTYLNTFRDTTRQFLGLIDYVCDDVRPIHIILGTILAIYILYLVNSWFDFIVDNTTKRNILSFVRNLPIVRTRIQRKFDILGSKLRRDLLAIYQNETFVTCLPNKSTSPELLLKKVKHYQLFDSSTWQQGRISGTIYTNNNPQLNEILMSVYNANMWSNPLHSDVFCGVRKMEAEIIRMIATMYNGNPKTTLGSVTSGGTESITMACKAYRDYAINIKCISGQPEIIAPITAHPAFQKAAHFLGCKIIFIPVHKKTFKADTRAMKRAITNNTCMLIGSAPQFPHGIIDPLRLIGELGIRNKIPVHVDACLGGFLIPFMKRAGHYLDEDFDFTVPGITSVSVDTHKYGYAPKGTSVVLYKDRKYIHQQYSIQTDWPGGIYASPTLPGSRPGGLIATCWAAMMYHGLEGYVQATDTIIKTTNVIRKELSKVDGLKILGDPQVSVLAFGSEKFDVYILNEKMKERGWNLNALQYPRACHLCVTLMHCNNNVASRFVSDVKSIAKQIILEPKAKSIDSTTIYGMSRTISDRSIGAYICADYLDGCLGF